MNVADKLKEVNEMASDILEITGFGISLCKALAMGLHDAGYRKQNAENQDKKA